MIKNRPLFTDIFEKPETFRPDADSSYIFGGSQEERAEHSADWENACEDVQFNKIFGETLESFSIDCNGKIETVRLRSGADLREFWRRLNRHKAYIDITGLEHRIWAPLIKSAFAVGIQLRVVYREPIIYRFSPLPREGDIFDLSERITGIAPLPGFARLTEAEDEEQISFVALLGFEGIRFKYCVEQVQPPRNRIIPIIGVPGFQAEYPFYTYDGNRPVLDETGAWSRARFARANCPFSLYYLLEEIASENRLDLIKVAMIGTKPHALGAVLFSLLSPRTVELIYDHPIRKASRTEGKGRVLVYSVYAMSLMGGV
ncbi:hypothetical protein [Terriglobus saanensis]|uniref:Uncharacterized protein n=1 Tax=Terriglobus saanensis (strain ATCC BAA-1853 / DSM 23119 / SP1PR4) TaxID=401053 RepID=E8UZ14_TERSS|nr:hypothetical protein [Terriglobus saanensis]ADV80959.1 hypothetical protein AciPR4_0118 [Terriglobus saanensis SP1PR4]